MKDRKTKEILSTSQSTDVIEKSSKLNVPKFLKNVSTFPKEEKIKNNNVQVSSHTEADVNWAVIANKITVPNIVKTGLTVGTASATSLLGAGIATGLGFAIGGPAGATVGYYIGNVIGFGTGAVGGNKFGSFVAKHLENDNRKDIIENGKTQIIADTNTKVEKTEEKYK